MAVAVIRTCSGLKDSKRPIGSFIFLGPTDVGKTELAREGYDPVHGARPLKRFLQRQVEIALSRKLLAGDITDHRRVTVDFRDGGLTFETKAGKR